MARPVALLLPLVALALAGCATKVSGTDLSGFASASAAISRQATTAITESNRLARTVSVEKFVRSDEVGLTEDKFQLAVRPEDLAAWQQSLSALEQYGNGIASLVDDQRQRTTADQLSGLAEELNSGVVGAKISTPLATAFASLGGAIVRHVADRTAHDLLVRADPEIQKITSLMAEAIGETDDTGLRGTTKTNWTDYARTVRGAYALAAEAKDLAKKRTLANEYLAILDKRDAQLKALADLAQSLRGLGAAHAAATASKPASVGRLLKAVEERADETKRIYDAIKAQEAADKGAKL